jgi:hypothetical protein
MGREASRLPVIAGCKLSSREQAERVTSLGCCVIGSPSRFGQIIMLLSQEHAPCISGTYIIIILHCGGPSINNNQ